MTRLRSLQVLQRDEGILPRIQKLKAEHPFWGCRRIWASWRVVEPLSVNKKRMLRLMRAHRLLVTPNLRLKAKRTPTRGKPKPTKPNEWWGIDMTKVLVQGFGWVYTVIVLDWYTKPWSVITPVSSAQPSTGWRPWLGRSTSSSRLGPEGTACL
jgi:putative transposase